jgi:class 3 adenylate cyclase
VKPPTGEVTIVFTDVVRAGALWEFNAEAMKDATILHNEVVRGLLAQHKGYEVVSTTREGAGGEGSLFVVFQDAARALEWCMAVQLALLEVQWPAALFAHPAAAEEWGDTDDRLIYRVRVVVRVRSCVCGCVCGCADMEGWLVQGLRVRMGVHVGQPRKVFNAMSRRAEYMGPAVNTAARITTMSHGGQIVVSQAVYDRIRDSGLAKEKKRLASLGKFDMPDSPQGAAPPTHASHTAHTRTHRTHRTH